MQLTLPRARAAENLVLAVTSLRQRAFDMLMALEARGERRRQRHALRRLDERTLSDLGLSAADVEREASGRS